MAETGGQGPPDGVSEPTNETQNNGNSSETAGHTSTQPDTHTTSPRPESDSESKIKQDESLSEKDDVKNIGVSREGSEMDQKSVDTRPASSDPSRPKSSTSTGMFVSSKGKKRRKAKVDPDAHQVTFTVTLSLAIPTGRNSFHWLFPIGRNSFHWLFPQLEFISLAIPTGRNSSRWLLYGYNRSLFNRVC